MASCIVIQLQEDIWLHVGLLYLNPQRPTYLRLHWLGAGVGGRVKLEAHAHEDGLPETFSDVEAIDQLRSNEPASIRCWRLLSFNRPHVPFAFAREVLVEPLDKSCRIPEDNHFCFWRGRDQELADETRRRMRKAQLRAKAAAQAKAKAAAAPPPADHSHGRGNRENRRAAQRPPDAGLPTYALPIADGSVEPVFPSRLLAEGGRMCQHIVTF